MAKRSSTRCNRQNLVAGQLNGVNRAPKARAAAAFRDSSRRILGRVLGGPPFRLLERLERSAPAALPGSATLQATLYQEQIELLGRQIRRLEQELRPRLLANEDIQRLLWIPGVGWRVAFTLYLEIDGIERFPSVRKFFSYCRVVPGAHNSAGKSRHGRRKDGNRYLKLALSHAAIRAIQHYPEIQRFYRRKARQKNPAIARTLVQKEIARAVYVVLKKQVDYNHTFKGQPLQRRKSPRWPRRASPDV